MGESHRSHHLLSKLADLVRFETANSALAFRATPYGAEDTASLLVDVLALANARVTGPRVLVLGVHDVVGGERRLEGVSQKGLSSLARPYKQAIRNYIKPALNISISSLVVDDRTLAVIVLRKCRAQPYVLGKDLSRRLRAGISWIRRGSQQIRLEQADLDRLYGPRPKAGNAGCRIRVAFEGPKLATSLKLPVLPLSSKPSELARGRIEGLLEAKKAAHDRLGATDTWLDRLAFARLHGADQPYETQTQVSLLVQLGKSEEENEAADQYYEYELRAHLINLVVVNVGDAPLNDASIVVEIPVTDGVAVADRIYPPVGVMAEDIPKGYPKVEFGGRRTQVVVPLGRVDAGTRQTIFGQPLRLLLREPAVGKDLPINCTLFGKELSEPAGSSLNVAITRDDERLPPVSS